MAAKLNPNPKGYNVYLFECLLYKCQGLLLYRPVSFLSRNKKPLFYPILLEQRLCEYISTINYITSDEYRY